MATKQSKPKQDALDALAAADPREAIALMLWKNRMANPDLAVAIDENDLKGYTDCIQYLKVKPQVRIFRPQGLPAQDAIPAGPGRRAVPARAAGAPKPYVMVVLTDQKGDAIVPVENNEDDYQRRQQQSQLIRYRENAPSLAAQLLQQARSGEYSLAVMQECADALVALATAARG